MTTQTGIRPIETTPAAADSASSRTLLSAAELSAMLNRVLDLSPESVSPGMRAAVEQMRAGLFVTEGLLPQDEAPDIANAAAAPNPADDGVAPALDNRATRLTIRTPGSARLVVLFVRALSQHPQVRFARLQASDHATEVEMLITLSAPLPLTTLLESMPGVARVRPITQPRGDESSRHMEIVLAHAGAALQAA